MIKIPLTHNKNIMSIILSQLKLYNYFADLQFLCRQILFPLHCLTDADEKEKQKNKNKIRKRDIDSYTIVSIKFSFDMDTQDISVSYSILQLSSKCRIFNAGIDKNLRY